MAEDLGGGGRVVEMELEMISSFHYLPFALILILLKKKCIFCYNIYVVFCLFYSDSLVRQQKFYVCEASLR